MSNGDIVRQLESATPDLHGGPISEPAFCLVSATESTARYFAPSSVLILIDRVLWSPMNACLTRKVTLTWLPSSPTEETVPTLTPATRTSSLGLMPAASLNAAE